MVGSSCSIIDEAGILVAHRPVEYDDPKLRWDLLWKGFNTRAFVEQFLIEHGFKPASRPDDPRDYVRDHIFGLRLC
jgi:hypothetical protein